MPTTSNKNFTVIEIQKIIRILEQQGIAGAKDLVGVSEQEIQKLEAFFDTSLPEAYRQFLAHFGRSAGFLSPWVAMYYDDLKEIKEVFDMGIAQGVDFQLPDQAFIIANIESTFDFFISTKNHNPEIYRVNLRAPTPQAQRHASSFTGWLERIALSSNTIKIPSDLYDETVEDTFGDLISS